jgi:hypothetical protein
MGLALGKTLGFPAFDLDFFSGMVQYDLHGPGQCAGHPDTDRLVNHAIT